MRTLLFRHGPAGERDALRWPDDDERPLTEKGESRTFAAARGLVWLEGAPTLVLTSPLRRALQSARALAEAAELSSPPEVLPALAPGGSWREVLLRLSQAGADDVVALVGHEPDLGKLAGVLVFGAPAALPLKKAGACSIQFEAAVQPGGGRLRALLPPKALRRLAGARSKV